MSVFFLLLGRLIPLYATVGLGFFAGRWMQVQRESVARIVFYLLVPFVMFFGVMRAEFTAATFTLPLITYVFSAGLSISFYLVARRFWKDATANIIGCTAGTGNTGYFGLPVATALFDEGTVAIYILLMLGVTLAESSIGYFLAARGHASWREALRRVLRLPTVYAFLLGVLLREAGAGLPQPVWDYLAAMRGAYTVLGMMVVGLGIAGMRRLVVDGRFIAVTYAAKFVAWPALALSAVTLDAQFFRLYDAQVHNALILLSVVPLAANTVVIAALLNIVPEKAASAVLLSTFVAIVYVPAMIALFIHP
ncbi:MAG: AEC family transporter [Alphaproteobacteria bacterium]|nr:AEC family transporter [Alphaproteobacteria bacterium]